MLGLGNKHVAFRQSECTNKLFPEVAVLMISGTIRFVSRKAAGAGGNPKRLGNFKTLQNLIADHQAVKQQSLARSLLKSNRSRVLPKRAGASSSTTSKRKRWKFGMFRGRSVKSQLTARLIVHDSFRTQATAGPGPAPLWP